jgi:hypothetical protein
MLALVFGLFLHGWRRETSLRFDSQSPKRWLSAWRDKSVWYLAVLLVAAGLIVLAKGFWDYSA